MSVGKKLFVGNLSYNTSDQELEAVFSEFGELKACFTVKEKGAGDKCKGYGYVVYKLKESCDKACAQVKVIKGRPVKVTIARSKKQHSPKGSEVTSNRDNQSDSDESDYETLTAKNDIKLRKPKSARGVARYDIGRTLVLKPLPAGTSEEMLSQLCEGLVGVVLSTVTSEQGVLQGLVTFSTHKNAHTALHKLADLKIKGTKIEAVLLSRATKGVSQSTLRKSRLIVRNLSFQCKEEELWTEFGHYGQVLEVEVPRKENGHMLGYAFVQFGSYFDADKALKGINGRPIKRRVVAVDWAVPKNKYEQALRKTTSGGKATPTNGSSDVGEASDSGGVSEGSKEGDVCEASDGSDACDSGEADNDSKLADKPIKKGHGSDVEEGRTLFIRNLPVGTDYHQLSAIFAKFGPIRYTRVLADPHSQLSKGSGFVQFKRVSSVGPCLSVANGDGLHLHGNRLAVSMAVSKEAALEFRGQDTKVKEDKRNLYLAKEGLILPGTPAAEQLSKMDMARRMKSYSERKAKLANPNYFVSTTRLSVRNLPTGVDEKVLRQVLTTSAALPLSSVTQVKILRSSDRLDGQGLGRSKGYGFVEFKGHEEALKTLRSSNNNPELFGEKRRLIVEFAIENSRALNLRSQRKQRQMAAKRLTTDPTADAAIASGNDGHPLSKRQRWRRKWQIKRLKRRSRITDPTVTSGDGTMAKQDTNRKEHSNAKSVLRTDIGVSKRRGKKRANSQPNDKTISQPPVKKMRRTHDRANLSTGGVKDRNHGNRKRRSKQRTDREEASFEQMVSKYRQRLEQTSLSKWIK